MATLKSSKRSSAQNGTSLQGMLFQEEVKPRLHVFQARKNDNQIVPCDGCRHLKPCGGLPQDAVWGCFTACFTSCDPKTCDLTCPRRPVEFAQRIREVQGLETACSSTLTVPAATELPGYIPVIYNSYSREQTLDLPIVAIPIHRVLKLRNGVYSRTAPGSTALHQEFRLAPHTKVLITSIAYDNFLEQYWRYARHHRAHEELAKLDLVGMTVPNFSYFTDAPRTHILYNRRRAMLAAERISDEGVGVIPHLNALTPADWNFWVEMLRAQPQLNFVCKEFQTGLAQQDAAENAIHQLAMVQDRIGRDLHPLLLGAARFVPLIARYFKRFTIIDSRPFISAVKRQKFCYSSSGTHTWEKYPTPVGAKIDALVSHNVEAYTDYILSTIRQAQ